MKKSTTVLSIALLIGFITLPFEAFAQLGESASAVTQDLSLQVDGSALLAVYNTNPGEGGGTGVSISLSGASVAGAEVETTISNSDTRLRISSLVESGNKRRITAGINPTLAGTGTQLFVTLANPGDFSPTATNGGTSTGEQELTTAALTSAVDVIDDITTCWSGTDPDNGYVVTYRYAKQDGATTLVSRDIVVTYTITAEEAAD